MSAVSRQQAQQWRLRTALARQRGFIINPFAFGGAAPAFSTWDATAKGSGIALSGGDLIATGQSPGVSFVRGSQGRSSGVYQFEVTCANGAAQQHQVGVSRQTPSTFNDYLGGPTVGATPTPFGQSCGWASWGQTTDSRNGAVSRGQTYTNAVIGVVVDFTAATITFYRNGSSIGTWFSSVSGTLYPAFGVNSIATPASGTLNVGATAFTYPIGGATAWG